MIGSFATWRNAPITFDQVDTGSATVQVGNYLRVSPNTSGSPLAAPNIEIGLYSEKTGKTTHTYGPRWTEMSASGGRTTAIRAGVNPTKADKRNHTYMTVRQESGNQWDVLYDFNKVGSTTKQLKVVGGNTNRVDVGLEVSGPKYVDVPSLSNRMQFMTGNKVWEQVATGNVAKSVTLPACSTTHKPPSCFTTKLTDNSKFAQWTVSKPRRQASAAASPPSAPAAAAHAVAALSAGLPGTFNGVDQDALQGCLEGPADNCLATVPGLSECVVTVRVCNAGALPAGGLLEDPGADADVSAADIRARAAAAFDVPGNDVAVEAPATSPSALAADPRTDSSGDDVWTVSSSSSTSGLQRGERRFEGFIARYTPRTGALLEACWGDLCEVP
ncbi:hypothetical protein OHB05_42740 [Streptomyces sp. NBC_00638]|uniref:hypothetical protein n=1 Tax=Streptomyces sp. NBC_00638 TaxID=2975794 RepID=UPI0022538416|nr:hypothetical protein [Streptomyces sp. NBC_00638]MCX5009236.1 hypothetical protein [Streptomyces sp. NBC_00638]